MCQGEDIVFERDGAGHLRKLGEGTFGQARAGKMSWSVCDLQPCILGCVIMIVWNLTLTVSQVLLPTFLTHPILCAFVGLSGIDSSSFLHQKDLPPQTPTEKENLCKNTLASCLPPGRTCSPCDMPSRLPEPINCRLIFLTKHLVTKGISEKKQSTGCALCWRYTCW